MKINTPYFTLKIEVLLIIVFLISILFENVRNFLYSFYICYLFIVFHELSHMFIAAILGKEIKDFKMSLAGVCITFKEEKYEKIKITKINNIKNIFIYLAGPLSNLIIAVLFQNIKLIFEINIFFALLNLIPLYPLDGYNILQNILMIIKSKEKNKSILKILEKVILLIFFTISILQIIYFKNPSMIIFVIYIYLQIKQKDVFDKNVEILKKIRY